MRIAIDARAIFGQRAGKGEYVYQIIKHLAKIDQKNQYFLYTRGNLSENFGANFSARQLKLPSFFWHFFVWLDLKFRLKPDIYFAPTSYIISSLGVKNSVIMVPDLVAFLFPKEHLPAAVFLEKIFLKKALRKSRCVITISRSTRDDLIRLFSILPDKIQVIYLAADQGSKKKASPVFLKKTREKYNLPSRFILSVGTLEPRKNLIRLLRAYRGLNMKECVLVLVGKKGWHYQEIFRQVRDLNLERCVRFLGYVPREDLFALYHLAQIFVYPSLYEGFGLPPLEAMNCGTAVITSKTSSLPEVAGCASILVNPRNTEELTRAMRLLLTNDILRAKLVRLGKIQAKKFSWEKTAREIYLCFKNLLK